MVYTAKMGILSGTLSFEGRKTVNFVDRCCLGKFLPGILKSIGGFGKECGLVSLEQESGPI